MFVKEKTNYKSILYKSYYVLEHAILNYNVRFILKSDDDAFVNVAALVHQLRQLCQSEVGAWLCAREGRWEEVRERSGRERGRTRAQCKRGFQLTGTDKQTFERRG